MSKFKFLAFKFCSREEAICAKLLSGLAISPGQPAGLFLLVSSTVVIETSGSMSSRTNEAWLHLDLWFKGFSCIYNISPLQSLYCLSQNGLMPQHYSSKTGEGFFPGWGDLSSDRVPSCIQASSLIKEFLTQFIHLSNLGKSYHLRSLTAGMKVIARQGNTPKNISRARSAVWLPSLS